MVRVAGRVAYAPELGSKEQGTYTPTIRNHLVLVVLSSCLSSKYIRWVAPEEIVECYAPEDYHMRIQDNVSRFLSDEFVAQAPEAICAEVFRG